jgi:hypothetical protein
MCQRAKETDTSQGQVYRLTAQLALTLTVRLKSGASAEPIS